MKKERIIDIVLAVLVLIFIGSFALMEGVFRSCTPVESDSALTDWMGDIDDGTSVACINIPGTHASGAGFCYPSYLLSNQDLTIKDQLNIGCRYLDIRVGLQGEDLILYNNFGKCRISANPFSEKIRFAAVIEDILRFLDEHPTETVIVAVKAENERDDIAKVQTLIQEVVSAGEDRFFTENHLPALGSVRGKIILARRYDDMIHAGERGGMHLEWKDQGGREPAGSPFAIRDVNDYLVVAVQDHYRYSVQDKWKAFEDTLVNCPANQWTISINFLSVMTGSVIPHPRAYAEELNAQFLDVKLEPGKKYGILAFDFVTREMAEKVIASNAGGT